jgi:hypothetical protein
MAREGALKEVEAELEEAAGLERCRKCECIKGAMRAIRGSLSTLEEEGAERLRRKIEEWIEAMGPSEYT